MGDLTLVISKYFNASGKRSWFNVHSWSCLILVAGSTGRGCIVTVEQDPWYMKTPYEGKARS